MRLHVYCINTHLGVLFVHSPLRLDDVQNKESHQYSDINYKYRRKKMISEREDGELASIVCI